MQPAGRRDIIQRPRSAISASGTRKDTSAFTCGLTASTCASQAAITSDGATFRHG